MAKAVMLLVIFCGFFIAMAMAAVYEIGNDDTSDGGWRHNDIGWRSTNNVFYQQWASNKNFHVGDTLVFNYNPYQHEYISYSDDEYHNVIQVTHDDFELCNARSPIVTYIDGFNKITLDKPGHYYFICSYLDHCLGGQKIDIMVTPTSPIASPNAASPHNQPSLNNAPSFNSSQLWLMHYLFVAFLIKIVVFSV